MPLSAKDRHVCISICQNNYLNFQFIKDCSRWNSHQSFDLCYSLTAITQSSHSWQSHVQSWQWKLWNKVETCSKLTTKKPERRYWRSSGVFIVNFKHNLHLILMCILLTSRREMPARKMDLTDLINRLRATFSKISQAIKTWVLCVSVDKTVT